MKHSICLAIAALCCAVSSADAPVRLMSYNIKNANGNDGRCDIERIARVISAQSPDVVAVQEVDSMTARSDKHYILGEIAALTGMHAFYAPAIDYDGGKYGIGLLSRTEPLSVRQLPLPGREERRTLFVADFPDYTFIGTHLSLTDDDRLASLPIIKAVADSCSRPVFVAGDFNDVPNSALLRAMSEDFTVVSPENEPTFPSNRPYETIDFIVMAKRGACCVKPVRSFVVPDSVASDHRPIVVEVDFEKHKCCK